MDFKTFENMGDEEMAGKIASIIAVIKVFGKIVLDKWILSPLKLTRMVKLGAQLSKNINHIQAADSKDEKLDSTITMIETILTFRRNNPKDVESFFDTLEEITQKYRTNPHIKQEILNILEKNAKS